MAHSYFDSAVRIDNSQTLVEHNTLNIGWLPDKGDLTVHRLEIHREGAVIDLLDLMSTTGYLGHIERGPGRHGRAGGL